MFRQEIKHNGVGNQKGIVVLRKYYQVYRELIHMQVRVLLTYRFNFMCGMSAELGWVIAKIIYSFVIFSIVPEERGIYFLLIGTYILLTGICMGVWGPNIPLLSNYMKRGELDIYMCKPISIQFLTTFYKIDFGSLISNAVCGGIMILYGWKEQHMMLNFRNVFSFVFALMIGLLICYTLFFIPQLLAFRYISTNTFLGVIWEIWDLNNLPFNYYPKMVQSIGLFIIPVLLPCSLPTLMVVYETPLFIKLWCCIFAVMLVKVFNILYKRGLLKYSSAGG